MSSFEVFDAAFCEYGLPLVMRTDNGVPFSARYGISALSAWWVELGVRPERIARGKPTQNGSFVSQERGDKPPSPHLRHKTLVQHMQDSHYATLWCVSQEGEGHAHTSRETKPRLRVANKALDTNL